MGGRREIVRETSKGAEKALGRASRREKVGNGGGCRAPGVRERGKIGSTKGSPAGRKREKRASGGLLGPRMDSRREVDIGWIPVEPRGFSVTASRLQQNLVRRC